MYRSTPNVTVRRARQIREGVYDVVILEKTLIGKELWILVPPIGALEGVEKETDSEVTCVCSPNKGRYLSLCPSS
jgi:hypothetical protein